MKIVGVDNHANETVADHLLLDGITETEENKKRAQAICDHYNRNLGDGPGLHYKLLPDDYRLSRGMADIVGDPDDNETNFAMTHAPINTD